MNIANAIICNPNIIKFVKIKIKLKKVNFVRTLDINNELINIDGSIKIKNEIIHENKYLNNDIPFLYKN